MASLVDSHCHINFPELGPKIHEVLQNAKENDVEHMLCVSVNLEDYPQVEALAAKYDNVYASVGVHPNAQGGEEPDTERLTELAQNPNVVAIGETGLDYFRSSGDLDWQKKRFENHIHAAIETRKPLIIHTREAADDTMDMLRAEHAEECGGVMHCFAEDWEIAKQALDIGFYISFSGIVTFKSAQNVQEVAQKAPIDRILVETDAPYLAPVPMRGKVNEPAYVKHTAQFVAQLRDMDYADLAENTTENFFRLFGGARR